MRRITSIDLNSSTSRSIGLFTGLYHSLMLVFRGTSETGEEVSLNELGTVRVTYRGQDIVNTDLLFLVLLNRLKAGNLLTNSSEGAGDSFTYNVIVPFYSYTNKLNSLPVTPNDNVQITLNWDNANINQGTLTIYGVHTNVPFNYFANYIRQDVILPAGQLTEEFKRPNIESVYFTGAEVQTFGDITNVQQIKDGKLISDSRLFDMYSQMLARNNRQSNIGLSPVASGIANGSNIYEMPFTGLNRVQESVGQQFQNIYTSANQRTYRQYIVPISFSDDARRISETLLSQGIE